MMKIDQSILNKIVIAVLLMGLTTAFSQVRGEQGPPPIPNAKQIEKMVDELDKTLSLNQEQEKKVLAVYQDHFKEVEKKTAATNRPNRQEMQKLRSEFEADINALLTKEQQKLYKEFVKEHKQRRGQPKKGKM